MRRRGLNYHGARYYAGWLGRWVSCDPRGIAEGPNLYSYVLGKPLKFVDPTGLGGEETDRILNELATWAVSLGADYKGSSPSSVKLHDILNTELPKSANSPLLITEAVIDKKGFIVEHGKGPQYVKSLAGGDIKGTYETIDVLVLEDSVSAEDVQRIRKGELSAKGKVVPADLKLGGASMSKTKAKSLAKRLGARPVLIGEHGRFFTSRAKLRRVLGPGGKAQGKGGKAQGKGAGAATVVAGGVDVMMKLAEGDVPGAVESGVETYLSTTPLAPVVFAGAVAAKYHSDPSIEQRAFEIGEWWEEVTGSREAGATAAALAAVGISIAEVIEDTIPPAAAGFQFSAQAGGRRAKTCFYAGLRCGGI